MMAFPGLILKADEFVEDPASRLNRLVDQQEGRIATIFRTAISALKDEIDLDDLADLIEQGRVGEAIERLQYAADQLAAASNVAFVTSGQSTADFLRAANVGRIVFDQVNLYAVSAMQATRLELIREFTSEQRKAASLALISGVEAGSNPIVAARNFRDAVGLTSTQWTHVANYRAALERVGSGQQSYSPELARAIASGKPQRILDAAGVGQKLRDGRGDKALIAALKNERALSPEKIDMMVRRSTERYVKHRAEVIGRTEALRAVNQGNEESYRQAIADGTIRAEQLKRTWRTRIDSRERRTHRFLNGQERDWGDPWVTENGAIKYPGDPDAPAAETIQCRCAILTRIRQ